MKQKLFKSFTKKNLILYITSFLCPVFFLTLMNLFYNLKLGQVVPASITPETILFSGLSALGMQLYLSFSSKTKIDPLSLRFLTGLCYSLSSFLLVQESDVKIFIIYALLPVYFYLLEEVSSGKKYFAYSIFGAGLLFVSPDTASPILILCTIIGLFFLAEEKRFCFSECMHLVLCTLYSYALAALHIIPYYGNLHRGGSAYAGFSCEYSPLMFLSRLFPESTCSSSFFTYYGLDLYFGLSMLIFALLFFVKKNTAIATKVRFICITLLLWISITCSPALYLLNLGVDKYEGSIDFSFLFIFWIIYLALKTLSDIDDITKKGFVVVCAIMLTTYGATFLFLSHNFHAIALPTIGFFLFLSLAGIYLCVFMSTIRTKLYTYLILFTVIELICNTFVITNQNFIPANRTMFIDTSILQKKEAAAPEAATPEAEATQTKEEASAFISTHSDAAFESLTSYLYQLVAPTTEDYITYSGTSCPDLFEQFNTCYKKMGHSNNLFTKLDATIEFLPNNECMITPVGNNIFNLQGFSKDVTDTTLAYSIQTDTPEKMLYVSDNITASLYKLSNDEVANGCISYIQTSVSNVNNLNIQITLYAVDEEAYACLPDEIKAYEISKQTLFASDIFGFLLSIFCLGIALLLLLNRKKSDFNEKVLAFKCRVDQNKILLRIQAFIKDNYVYLLSLLLPFGIFILSMIFTGATPFGNNTIFDQDGSVLTVPNQIDFQNTFRNGNFFLGMNSGYGTNNYSGTILLPVYYLLHFLPFHDIAGVLSILEALSFGFAGFNLTYYLTHRYNGKKAHKRDYRLLIPALIFTLNNYMLAMHSFNQWYFAIMLFPLVVLSMEKLLFTKKPGTYILLLTLSIYVDLYMSLYVCIFLALYFFVLHFDSFADFIRKGILFALCSILAACNGIACIANVLLYTNDSAYRVSDSSFPSFGFFTNFLNQWKQYMFLTSTTTVTSDDGILNAYCGIFTLILVILYVFSKNKTSDKIKNFLLIAFLTLSFNGKVLSFVINGFHYQSKVPNRHVFLLMFLLSIISYDTLVMLKRKNTLLMVLATCSILISFVLCQLLGYPNTTLAFIFSIIMLFLYTLLLLMLSTKNKRRIVYPIFICIVVLELLINSLYNFNKFGLYHFSSYGDYNDMAHYFDEYLDTSKDFYRVGYPVSLMTNVGKAYDTGSVHLFNSYVSMHQTQCNFDLGYVAGANIMGESALNTPYNRSLSCVRYIMIPYISHGIPTGLEQFDYLGIYGNYYIFENKNAFSLGSYFPKEYVEERLNRDYRPDTANKLVQTLTKKDIVLYDSLHLSYDETGKENNSFYFTDTCNNPISFEKAQEIYAENAKDSVVDCMSDLHICYRFTPIACGSAYFYTDEYTGLGSVTTDVENTGIINFPNCSAELRKEYNIVILNNDTLDQFYQSMQQNQVTNVAIKNDTITCNTNYENAGYTLFSIAAEEGWSAFIDGQEVEIEDPYRSFIFIKTPAGKHEITLKFMPNKILECILITLFFWMITFVITIIFRIKNIKK